MDRPSKFVLAFADQKALCVNVLKGFFILNVFWSPFPNDNGLVRGQLR